MENFRKLGLSEQLLKLMQQSNLTEPSEIQEKAIPLVMQGKDVLGGSATGSGKTLAFGAGIIEKTEKGKGLQVLVITPTRELAEQVGGVFKKFSAYKGLSISLVYGGMDINPQIKSLQKSEICVGTPGRILDHIERKTINISHLKTLVIDEADKMFDMGFIKDIEKIINNSPKNRQTLLFSATLSDEVMHIAKKHMSNPENISVESYVDPEKLKQIYYNVPKNIKFSLLVHLLKKETSGLIMIFCNTRRNTDFVADNLRDLGIEAVAIHGGLVQEKRNKIMQKFHEKKTYVLVCTDIAARGLDIKGVSHVYNYDIPKTSKEYIHRIGRTARAGKEGIAVNILAERDYENFRNVLRDESLEIKRTELPENIKRVGIKIDDKFSSQRRRPNEGRGYEKRGSYGDNSRGKGDSERRGGNFRVRRNIRQRSGNYRSAGQRFSGRSQGKPFGGRRRFK